MARLTSKARKALPSSDFALPKSAGSGKAGKGSFPIPDANHARNALARVASKPPAQQATVRSKVKAKFPEMSLGAPKKGGRPKIPGAGSGKHPQGEPYKANHKAPGNHDEFMRLGADNEKGGS